MVQFDDCEDVLSGEAPKLPWLPPVIEYFNLKSSGNTSDVIAITDLNNSS